MITGEGETTVPPIGEAFVVGEMGVGVGVGVSVGVAVGDATSDAVRRSCSKL